MQNSVFEGKITKSQHKTTIEKINR
ncbi:CRISPR-associated endonuclease Cas2 [Methanosphaera stadtmanae]